ncbi:MAG TPA: 50S ribosomal protein L24 [Candidatus Dormibacteraeota bacterium]|nr:50S ribosomal protein L24 [Candidatus Dormibacteraeota bacterium]
MPRPSRERKEIYDAEGQRLRKLLAAPLSDDLREAQGRRSYPVRKGDTVKIVRGDFAGVEGKVTDIDTHGRRLFVEGVTREMTSGTSTNVSVHSSKVMITKLNLDDKWRADSIKLTPASAAKEGA